MIKPEALRDNAQNITSAERIKVLVTGGAGYIGSQVCKTLYAAGFLPVVYDNFSTGLRSFVQWGPMIEGDLCDKFMLARSIDAYRPAAVLHFAARAYVGESAVDPAQYYYNNVVGTLTLMNAARAAGNIPIVFSSTCAVYGEPQAVPVSEHTSLSPVSPYGRTKLTIEHALCDYDSAYGLRSVRLRYFNACGCDPAGEVGEVHNPETHLIPRAILAAIGYSDELVILGDDYPTPDGTAIRDYVHVVDLAEAHVAALRMLLAGGSSATVNLGTGIGFSVLEIVNAVEWVTGLKVPRRIRDRRPGDPPKLVADAVLARRLLGFSTPNSSLETIIGTTHGWLSRTHAQR